MPSFWARVSAVLKPMPQMSSYGACGHLGDRLVAIGPVDADGPRGADAMGLQEHHDLADGILLGPSRNDPLLAFLADAFQGFQRFGTVLDDLEHGGFPKALTNFRAKCGPMPFTIPEPRYF
jgi:hypothetical protein